MTDVRNIDYFSLDVEGAEIYILNQLDFSKFNIKVFTIEVDQNENKIVSQLSFLSGKSSN